uniref:Short transient receptor potential channel 6 n=1 Tax=Echinococcus granulosus TaxID=6210 RepID=A0A068WF47_ECHGR|nr:short transient receptor potential channel 6 [Echinococcus granulosus]
MAKVQSESSYPLLRNFPRFESFSQISSTVANSSRNQLHSDSMDFDLFKRPLHGFQLSMSDLKDATSASKKAAGCLFTNFEDVRLTDEERVYLNAASIGDVGVIRMSLEDADSSPNFNVNCVDYMGRNALHLAVDSENIEAIEMLLDKLSFECIEEALLHGISKGLVKIVRVIIEHPNYMACEERLKRVDSKNSFFRTTEKSQFSPDITPLILSAHYNNHEMVQMFLSRSHTIEKPHPISCQCTDCQLKQDYDSLKRSRSRLNAYRALASPAYMALSSPDPIMATFELRQEMMKLAEIEKEFKREYLTLVEQCMNFACEMMDLCRGTQEVEAVISDFLEDGANVRDPLGRLRLAIRFEEKKFVAHPNCQQYLTSIWYGSETAFLQSWTLMRKIGLSILAMPLLPLICVLYIVLPSAEDSCTPRPTRIGSLTRAMRCPATKFATHCISHFLFLILLSAATFRLEENYDIHEDYNADERTVRSWLEQNFRPNKAIITHVQVCIVLWIAGHFVAEMKHIYYAGLRSYMMSAYNIFIYCILALYMCSYTLRIIVYGWVRDSDVFFNATNRIEELIQRNESRLVKPMVEGWKSSTQTSASYFIEASRFRWKADDPEIVSDVLFAIANVLSFARTTYLMPAFEALGPLQISFTRMLTDIVRFMVLYILVIFAFMVGLHNLYWYYGLQLISPPPNTTGKPQPATEAFEGLRHTLYSLFWAMFSQVSISRVPIRRPDTAEHKYTDGMIDTDANTVVVDSVGMILFAVYHGIIIIVLVNMLIAMMSHSFESIQEDCDVEWKFARTKLWLNYIDNGSTLPAPFNILPTAHSLAQGFNFLKRIFKNDTVVVTGYVRSTHFIKTKREKVCKNRDLEVEETSYADIMQRLVRRYLFKRERAKDAEGEKPKESLYLRADDLTAADMYAAGDRGMDFADAEDDIPPLGMTQSRSTPAGNLGDSLTPGGGIAGTSARRCRRSGTKRCSIVGGAGIPFGLMAPFNIQLPQLDGIQRSQKVLDMRLQNLQSQSEQLNSAAGNARIKEEVIHVRSLITESQRALSSIIKAVSQLQEQVVLLNENMEQWIKAQIGEPNKRTILLEERRPAGSSKMRERHRPRRLTQRSPTERDNSLNPYV